MSRFARDWKRYFLFNLGVSGTIGFSLGLSIRISEFRQKLRFSPFSEVSSPNRNVRYDWGFLWIN